MNMGTRGIGEFFLCKTLTEAFVNFAEVRLRLRVDAAFFTMESRRGGISQPIA